MKFRRRQLIRGVAALSAMAMLSSIARALPEREIVAIAEGICVRVISAGEPGSGIVVHREGNTYFVLTAWHVIQDTNANEEIIVVTPDGEYHQVTAGGRQQQPNVDLAVLQFDSNRDYPTAAIGDSQQVGRLYEVFVAGYSNRGSGSSQLSGIEITRGEISALDNFGEGYRLRYTSQTASGMSGGPVLNRDGQLIGVHGRAEGSVVNGIPLKEGFNYGIPIHIFVAWTGLNLRAPVATATPGPSATTAPSIATPTPGAIDRTLIPYSFDVVTVDSQGNIANRERRETRSYVEALGRGSSLEMVRIPSGSFLMGSPDSEYKREPEEGPQRQVAVSEFYFGKYEVTQEQWRAVALLPKVNREMTVEPAKFKGARRPVESITWFEAKEFCDRLSRKTGLLYRLPSEAEWEYACRAGTITPFHYGETIATELANYQGSNDPSRGFEGSYGNGPAGDFRRETVLIGTFKAANAFGLFDMHGNVSEWCEDLYFDSYVGAPSVATPRIQDGDDAFRALRGGSWTYDAAWCRSAYRDWADPNERLQECGLRVACSLNGSGA